MWTAPSSERVVLVAPPAETALLSPAQARVLAQQLMAMARSVELRYAEIIQGAVGGSAG